jgi:hypothetical protein
MWEVTEAHAASLLSGSLGTEPAGTRVLDLVRRHGALRVPNDFTIVIVSPATLMSGARGYQENLERSLKQLSVPGRIRLITEADALKRVETMGSTPARPGHALLIAVSGTRGMPVPSSTLGLLRYLDAKAIRYRLFSVDNRQGSFSAVDQLGSIMSAAGGALFGLHTACVPRSTWFLGIDLAHPKDRDHSCLAVSLVRPDGTHAHTWRSRQARDETADRTALSALLAAASQFMKTHAERSCPVVVVRDGRHMHHESAGLIPEVLQRPTTVLELAKGGAPLVYDGETFDAPPAGTALQIEGGLTALICPVRHKRGRAGWPTTHRVIVRAECDELCLGVQSAAKAMIGLSYAPGLGLEAHALCAPIYWADGIASAGFASLQFCGQDFTDFSTM